MGLSEAFASNGFAFPLPLLARDEAEACRARVLGLLDEAKADPRVLDWLYYKANVVFPWVDGIVHRPALLDAVAAILGPDLLLWSASFAIKPPRSAGRYTWHQDATYWGLEPPEGLTAWLALGDVGPENGGMQFAPGRHRGGQLPHINTFAADVMLPRGQEIAGLPGPEGAVDLRLGSGEASFHHVFTPHASGPNRSDAHRIGLGLVFLPTRVRQVRGRDSALLVKGQDAYGHFEGEPRPLAERDAAAIAAHRRAMTQMATWRAEQELASKEAR